VLELLGGPRSCDSGTWVYVAGQFTGPEITYEFTVKKGVVTKIELVPKPEVASSAPAWCSSSCSVTTTTAATPSHADAHGPGS
jgi:hypothetical protein